jgi:uncharacterized protein (DUF934 family)
MRRIIKNREIVGDNWIVVADDEPVCDGVDALVSLKRLVTEHEQLRKHQGRLGVLLTTADAAEDLAPYLDAVQLVAVDFPKFTDGRAYSLGRLVRLRLGWTGELRATGDVLPDQVFYMQRVGFDSFAVREDKKLETALAALDTFSVRYQGSGDDGPLFRRRFARPRRAASGS